VVRVPIVPAEVGGRAELLDAHGDLRTLPSDLPDPDSRLAGLDGFFAARLARIDGSREPR
jgi:16S rRNA (cytosine967-C5)-methyltransferase